MPVSTAGLNKMLDALGITHVSLHTADPGDTGTSEATGGAPAYARKAITWNAAAAKNLDSATAPVFDVPAGTYTHWGGWDALSAGNFLAGGTLSASEIYAGQGTYTLTDADISAT